MSGNNQESARDLFRLDGHNHKGTECPFAVRIIRKARKPAKVKKDRDAAWCRKKAAEAKTHASHVPGTEAGKDMVRFAARLRRIAKRLESRS